MEKHHLRNALLGLLVGDALGVPAEFKPREHFRQHPVTGMTGYGTHHQPPGTWSDDSSLTLCLAEALCDGYDLRRIAQSFVDWYFHARWTPHGEVFDIGIATRQALEHVKAGIPPEVAGGTDEYSNGNGSLMRILPLYFNIRNDAQEDKFLKIKQVSSITHGHIRSVLACFYYLEMFGALVEGQDKQAAYATANASLKNKIQENSISPAEAAHFDRLLSGAVADLPESAIHSSGYVIHSLEAAVWCLLTSGSYPETVLKAVNLGEDTDTTAAIVGGLAGVAFGPGCIPQEWIAQLARLEDIEALVERMVAAT